MTQAASSFLSIAIGGGSPPDPYTNPQAWDKIRVAGTLSPFVCRVKEFKRKWDWDEKKPKGGGGAVLTYTGFHLARGSVEFDLLYGPDPFGRPYTHLADWYRFSQLFRYTGTKVPPQPVTFYHPSTNMIGITAVICEDITNPVLVSVGLFRTKVSLIEFQLPPPVSTTSSPLAAAPISPGALKPPGLTPNPAADALQAQIATQLKIWQSPLPKP